LNTFLTVSTEDFESLEVIRSNPDSKLIWDLVFTLPAWLKVWWQHFGTGAELYLRSVKQGNNLIGIAPLRIRDGVASFIGSDNVCDYQDFLTTRGTERDFFQAILGNLHQEGIRTLKLDSLRPDSAAIKHLIPLARELHYSILSSQQDVSLDMDLPFTWEEYLNSLDGKQRHELRRKMRKLHETAEITYRVIEEKTAIPETINDFLRLFPEARRDKAQFMTPEMQDFFRSLAISLAEVGIAKFGILEFNHSTAAEVMFFDYNGSVYLYNSAYVPGYRSLSVGIISKTSCIEDSIQKHRQKFDFLKGSEHYKYYLGGKEIPLYSCQILLP
jgi:CelD/BcsL family acetyltransferase involved in cellulose biosynthesis